MDLLHILNARIRYLKSRFTPRNSDSGSHDDATTDDITRATRLLRLVKLLLVITVTALTIAQMLGWL